MHSKKFLMNHILSAITILVFVFLAVGSTDSDGNNKSDTVYMNTNEVIQFITNFEEKIGRIEKIVTEDIQLFNEALKKYPKKYSLYELYQYAENAEKSCQIAEHKCFNLQISNNLPTNIYKHIKSSRESLQLSFIYKKEAFKSIKKYLDNNSFESLSI